MKPLDNILYAKGNINELKQFQIGSGVESFTVNNSPFSVLKVLQVSPKQMKERNLIPTSIPCSLRVIVEDNDQIYYIYHQIKVNIVPKDDLLYAFKRLDIAMIRYGYFPIIGYSDDSVRVYTDGFAVIDDIGLGNIGYGLDDKIHIIDCTVYDAEDWESNNNFQIPNKIVSIAYNSNSLLKQKLESHLKDIEFNINSEIK